MRWGTFLKALRRRQRNRANQTSNAVERLQAVITAEKSKMKSMVESMVEGVIMIDGRGEIAVLNPQARRMLDLALDEEVTSKVLLEKMKAPALDKILEEFQGKGRLITKEIAVPQGEKSVILRSDLTSVKDAEENIVGIVAILRNITKEKEVDRMKTEFISTVSHELRTPLTIMKEFISIILDEIPGKLTSDQKKYVGIIKGNIDRLARLINNLLDISKIEDRKIELKRAPVDIANLANGVIFTLKSEADKKHIEFKTLFRAPLPGIYVDSDRITQVFTNLIGNAVEFTPQKGQIAVEVIDRDKEIECSVTDTGVGIAPENLDKLFGRFQQFGRVTGPGTKGTGLGLAITKELVQMHNGKIWVESKLGKGSKFIFTLPKYTAESLFKEYINNGIKKAMKEDLKMSVIVVSIAEPNRLKQSSASENLNSILRGMEDILSNSLRREEGDAALKNNGEVVVILADCNRENALRVEGRLEHVLEDYLARKKMAGEIKLRFGCATYPDEAKSDEELIKKAKESVIRR